MVVHRSIELHQEAAMGTFVIMNDLILAVLSFIVSFFYYEIRNILYLIIVEDNIHSSI